MNVYIYGNNSFKKEIHETLEHANIKFKLDDDSVIKEINSLNELKEIISNNPNDIYLIDDEKIIKKNGITKKLKFLAPKDGIQEEFLLDNGIADLSVDSLKEIPKYILQKHEQQQKEVSPEIQESIADIVDEAYSEDALDENINSSIDDDLDNFELDDELAELLSKGEDTPIEIIELDEFSVDESEDNIDDINIDDLDENALDSLMNFDEDVGLNNVSYDYDDEKIVNDKKKHEEDSNEQKDEMSDIFDDLENDDIMKELDSLDLNIDDELDDLLPVDLNLENTELNEEPKKGEKMSDDFSELDSLSEADILSALNGLDNVNIVKEEKSPVQSDTSSNNARSASNESVDINSSNSQDIANLITKLLNNKTLEITIKIKD